MLALGVAARRAHAEPLPVALDWEAPPECPTQAEVIQELTRITRVKPGRVVTPVHARAKIEQTGNKYQLHLRTEREDQTGDTDLDASDCLVLKRGVTLVLALALGDGVDVMDEKSSDEPEPPAAPAPEPAPPRPVRPPAPPLLAGRELPKTRQQSPDLRIVPAIAGTAASGFVGDVAFGAQLSLALRARHFEAFAEGGLWPARAAARVQGVTATLEAATGSVAACAREPFGELALSGCARFTFGAIHARSAGAYRDGSSTAPYSALGPALVLAAPLAGGVALRAEAALDVTLAPPSFAERDFGAIYSISRIVPQLSLGLAFEP